METYKSNSHKSKEEPNKKEVVEKHATGKVITGVAQTKKRGIVDKLASIFVPEDIGDVKTYIFAAVLIPAVKSIISDTIDTILYPEGSRNQRSSNSIGSRINYGGYSSKPTVSDNRERVEAFSTKMGYNYDDILIPSRGDAEQVLSSMEEILDRYGLVSVADFYDLVGVTGKYTDNKYGWTDLTSAVPMRANGGKYIIKLPKAIPLN